MRFAHSTFVPQTSVLSTLHQLWTSTPHPPKFTHLAFFVIFPTQNRGKSPETSWGPSGAFYTDSLNLRVHFRGHLRVHSRAHFREHFLERVRGSNFAVRVLCARLTTGAGVSGRTTGKISTGNNFPRKDQRIPQNYYQYGC